MRVSRALAEVDEERAAIRQGEEAVRRPILLRPPCSFVRFAKIRSSTSDSIQPPARTSRQRIPLGTGSAQTRSIYCTS